MQPRDARAAGARSRTLVRNVTFSGQHVAAVIAETFEQATAAAAMIAGSYEPGKSIASRDDPRAGGVGSRWTG